ncbi:MAG: chemotaxis protein CheA [Myxococcota bacterium]
MPVEIDDETREIVDYFLTEGREGVEELELMLLSMEGGNGADGATIDSMFRIFHSIKGSAGYLEFSLVESVTHKAETVLQMIREGQLSLSRDLVDCLVAVLDFLNGRLDNITTEFTDAGAEDDADILVKRLLSFIEAGRNAAAPAPQAPPAEPPPLFESDVAPVTGDPAAEAPSPKGAREPIDFPRLGDILLEGGYVSQEQLHKALQKSQPLGALLLNAKMIAETQLRHALTVQAAARQRGEPLRLGQVLVAEKILDEKKVLQALSAQDRPLGEALVANGLISDEELDQALTVQHKKRKNPNAQMPKAQAERRNKVETLRVDVRKLNSLMDLVGELIIAATAIIHNPELVDMDIESFQKSAMRLGRVTRSLQDVAMSVRMVPVDGTFRKMHRLVRDVSHKQGKEVDLRISGEETEVDKKVAEIIADPLVHLMRNAIDHGLESTEDRIKAGKPKVGVIKLEARHQGGEIWISISDDGGGIDRNRILKKARERGLPDAHRADLTDAQIYGFIFEPGFSTASQLSDISGRGIGMDVVKRNIEKVKGRIDVTSKEGKGTTFTLRIPLTLAIIEGMLVQVGESCFTIPLLQIKESVVVSASDITTLSDGQEVARIRDQLIPVLRLHQFYNIEPGSTDLTDGILVVLEDGGQTISLFVDELIGQRQTVVKGLSGYLGDVPGLGGCTVLGDGRISLIIDVTSLIAHYMGLAA